MKKRPKCDRVDCFAYDKKTRFCSCLKDNDFKRGACPFYKHKDEVDKKQIEADIKSYEQLHT